MKAHLGGRAHQLLVKRKIESSGILSSAAGTDNTISSPDETTAESSIGATSEQTGPPASLGTNLTKVYHCAKCNITLNSQKQLEQHNRGLRHKIVIGKAKPPPVNGMWHAVFFLCHFIEGYWLSPIPSIILM